MAALNGEPHRLACLKEKKGGIKRGNAAWAFAPNIGRKRKKKGRDPSGKKRREWNDFLSEAE